MKTLVFLFCLFLPGLISAQIVQFDRLETVKGLANRSVTSIIQDDLGFLWFGTQDGLIRYDGYDIRLYKTNLKDPNSLSDNNVRAIAKDKKGNIWIATQGGGLDRFNILTESFTHFRNEPHDPHSLSGNAVWSVFVDSKDRIWAGTFSNGLNMIDPVSIQITRIEEKNFQPVLAIAEDADKSIWFSSNGINHINPETMQLSNFPASGFSSLSAGGIRSLLQDEDGLIWIGAVDGGLFKFDTRNKSFHKVEMPGTTTQSASVYAIERDQKGRIWAGGNDGLSVINGDEISFCKNDPLDKYSISTNAVRAIYSDRSGIVWIGTEGGGVNHVLSRKNFQVYRAGTKKGSLSYNVIRSVYEDSKGGIWVGTQGGGLNIFDPIQETFSQVKLDSREISSIYEDRDGTYWIGSWGSGLFHCDFARGKIENFRHTKDENSLLDDRIQVVHRDIQGVLWVGTESGLSSFDPVQKKWTAFKKPNFAADLTGNNIQGQAFLESADGTLWIGTWFGLNKVSPDRQNISYFTSDTTGQHLSSDHVISLYHDEKKNLMWIGTFGGGLNLLNLETNAIIHYTEDDGLPNNTIFGIREDKDGNLWMSTNNGLSRFNPQTGTFRNYDATEGLQGNEFYWGGVGSTRSGKMLFGGVNGLTVFDPADIKDNNVVPPIAITSFEIFNKIVAVKPGSLLEKNVNFTDQLFLNYDQNVLTFQYSALNYNSPEKNVYAYYLENFDHDWNYVGSKRSISYTNLNPGEYILHVKGSNNDGVWNEKGVSLKITVIPPFWRTWWFYSLVGAITIGGVYLLIKLRLRSVRHDKEIIRKTLQEALDNAHYKLDLEKKAVLEEQNKNMERNWIDQSLSIVSEILSRSKNDVQELCSKILSALVKRCEVVAGAIYLYDESSDELVKQSNYGFSTVRLAISPGSGQIGECFATRQSIVISNLPDNYFSITSGLGSAKPQALLLVPLQYEEICVGVIELASFTEIPQYRKQFIEALSAQLTATIHTTQMSQKTTKLLEESRVQTEELKVREEELKQNLEEMQAIQEDYSRKAMEYELVIKQLEGKLQNVE
jgi:ligand-binding sensor domain-containing protein/GAF domain-containing protein